MLFLLCVEEILVLNIKQIRPSLETQSLLNAEACWRPRSAFPRALVGGSGGRAAVVWLGGSQTSAAVHPQPDPWCAGSEQLLLLVLHLLPRRACGDGWWVGPRAGILWLEAEHPNCFVLLNSVSLILAFRKLAADGASTEVVVLLIRFD